MGASKSSGRPLVPQTGTWQFKTTPTKGYIIIGHDDDTVDSAKFVRMVNGYGYPVTLNSTGGAQTKEILSDADEQYSTYPSGSTAQFPSGTTIGDLNKYVIANNKGEIALHGGDVDKAWDSALLTGEVLDTMYETYTQGGGTKTKAEMKEAIMETYADTDVSQGASIVAYNRQRLETALGSYVYTIGMWGGGFYFKVDDITVGNTNQVASGTQKISRAQNYMGDGLLADQGRNLSPYWIYRNSSGLTASGIEALLTKAYNRKVAIEGFQHYWLDGTQARWDDFKTTMDTIKSWVDQGKIEVVTRKGYYELGEWAQNPITSIAVAPTQLVFLTGTTLSASDFSCTATLEDNTVVNCESDKILDFSDVDTSTEGIYTVTLQYRGFSAVGTVIIADAIPTNFLLENGSYSGESMVKSSNYGDLSPSVSYEANKHYRIQFKFKAVTEIRYTSHVITFTIASTSTGWRTNTSCTLNTTADVTEGTVTFDINTTQAKTLDKLTLITALTNTTVGAWEITNAYIYEVPT